MPGATAASLGGGVHGGAPPPMSLPQNSRAPAVSATKRAAPSDNSTLRGELCIALYKPKKYQGGIWWPALRFASMEDFQQATVSQSLQTPNFGNSAKSLQWTKPKHNKRLVKKILRESMDGNPIETLCYLGRPLEDYVTADDAQKLGIEVQDFWKGLVVLTQQAKHPHFAGLFLQDNTQQSSAHDLFCDFYLAMDEVFARNNQACADDSDSDSDSEDESSSSNLPLWSSKAQGMWDAYQSSSHSQEEASPKPLLQAQEHNPQQHNQHHNHHDDAVSIAQSAAAVSYTEASLTSASKAGGSVLTPPKLEESTIDQTENFDSIWHKHEMEGWDRFLEEDNHGGEERMVYQAPNGYNFYSEQAFLDFLMETYGNCGQELPKKRGRSKERRNHQANNHHRASSRSRSRSRDNQNGGTNFSELWLHLTSTLGWTYNYATQKDIKIYGLNTTAIWFRPGYDMKHRGELGEDHFVSEDAVLKYCQENNIEIPPREQAPSKNEKEQDVGESSEEEEEDDEDDDSSAGDVASNDAGYSTPDDQSTVPQDPGKPRLPSPPNSSSSGASGSSGGSYYSYDNDPDRYVFTNLWQRLKSKGWSWIKPKKSLDDYWYIKPASMRPESEWKQGRDYFCDEEEVIEFCKKRDLLSMKDREARRKDRLRKMQSDWENSSTQEEAEEESSPKPAAKATKANPKKRGRPATKATKPKKGATKRQASKATVAKATDKKRGRKRKENVGKKANLSSCDDNTLKVKNKRSPWARDMPRYEHKLCLKATGMSWANSFYWLPGEDRTNFTARFVSVEDVARHFALNSQTLVWASGGKSPSNDAERSFQRLIRYALVPGVQSAWSEIRKITRSETAFLLRKLGYKNTQGTTFWEPPEALVAMNHLEERYSSLESLCESLWCLEGDLKTPPSAATRRRNQELSITPTQFMAIRLRIAEGFSDSESEEERSQESESVSEKQAGEKKRKRGRPQQSDAEEEQSCQSPSDQSTEASENDESISEEEADDKKRKRAPSHESDADKDKEQEEEEQLYLTPSENDIETHLSPSEKRTKEFAEDEEQQIALSPSKIKVGKFRKNPEDNTAPWAIKPLKNPKGGWTNLYFKMGCSFQNGRYYLKGESCQSYTKRFTSVEGVRDHINEAGNHSEYLDKLEGDERKLVRRHWNYGHVPGNSYEWRKLRELTIQETIIFLNLLGFERAHGEHGWWQIPDGVPILEQRSYPTLSELCNALVRLPDLEDRTMGMGNRRRARKKKEDLVLSDYQMMALRLRIAEGFDQEVESVVDEHQKQSEEENRRFEDERGRTVKETNKDQITEPEEEREQAEREGNGDEDQIMEPEKELKEAEPERKDDEASQPLFEYTNALFEQLEYDTSVDAWKDLWKALRNLGVAHNGKSYRVPGHRGGIDTEKEMINYILENTVAVLNWENCSLDTIEVRDVQRYLKAFNARGLDFSLVKQALKMTTKANITEYLRRIGIHEDDGKYYIEADEYNESAMVNMIRRTPDLNFLVQNRCSPVKRRRSSENELLSKAEMLSLRLWAVLNDTPLTNMPEASTIGSAYREVSKPNDCTQKSTDEENETSSIEQVDSPSQKETNPGKGPPSSKSLSNSDDNHSEDSEKNEAIAREINVGATSELEERTTQAERNVVLPPASENRASTEQNSDVEVETAPDSADAIAKRSNTTIGVSSLVTNVVTASVACHDANQIQNPSATEGATEITEAQTAESATEFSETPMETEETGTSTVDTESAIRITEAPPMEFAAESFETDVPMETEEAETAVDAESTAEATEPSMFPVDNSVMESASKVAKLLMQRHEETKHGEPIGQDGDSVERPLEDSLMTPSPKKKRRKSNKEKRRTETFPLGSPPGFSDYHTPKQHNYSSNKKSGHRNLASRTASSHKEAFGDSLGNLMTQPCHEEDENDHHHYSDCVDPNLRDMEDTAELDFHVSSDIFSPEAVVATKKLSPTQQHYGSRYANVQPCAQDFFTQEDNDEDGWFDKALPQP